MGTDAIGTEPEDRELDEVHEAEAGGIRDREDEVHADGVSGIVLERLVEALLGMFLLAEGTDHARAGDGLAQACVHAVDEALEPKEDRRRLLDGKS